MRTEIHCRTEQCQMGAAMPPFAVDKQQGLVRRESAQRNRAHKGARIAGQRCSRKRGHEVLEILGHVADRLHVESRLIE